MKKICFFENEYFISLAYIITPGPPQGHCSLFRKLAVHLFKFQESYSSLQMPCHYQFLLPVPNCHKIWEKKSISTPDLQPRPNMFYVIKQEQLKCFKERRTIFFNVTECMRKNHHTEELPYSSLTEWLGLVAVELRLNRSKAMNRFSNDSKFTAKQDGHRSQVTNTVYTIEV